VTVPGYPAFNDSVRQPPLGPGEELVGKYRVEQVIGAGAMGVVVLAWHIELEQQVAIKFLYPELAGNENGAERFRREARAAVRIQNEHVARVLDVGTLDGPSIPFIVMEYLEGRDLARELKERRTLPPLEAVGYVRQACEAVAEAHSLGIVHRDLKPANLFLGQRPNGTRLIKVLDFGISKLVTGPPQRLSITDTSILLGSPAYMSPEQLECSRSVDGRADIWSLGVILYELIAGRLPFNGESVPQLIRSVVTGARAPLVGSDALLARLEPIVERCLMQERAERFQSVAELSAALDAATRLDAADQPLELARTRAAQFEPAPTLEMLPGSEPSAAGEPPAAGEGPAELAGTGPSGTDGAWGRTHGARRVAWQRQGIPLAALLALIALGGVWGVRSERRAAEARAAALRPDVSLPTPPAEPSRAPQPERVVAQLAPEPQVAPVPASEPSPPEPAAPAVAAPGAAGTPGVVASKPPAPPTALQPAAPASASPAAVASTPAPSTSAAALTPPTNAPPGGASDGESGAAQPPSAGAEPLPAKAPAAEPSPGAPSEVVPPRDGRFEIPEFGGRE